MNKKDAVLSAFEFLTKKDTDIPHDILTRAAPVIKTFGVGVDMITRIYRDTLTNALIEYFEGGSIVSSRNAFKRAMVEAFGGMYDLAWSKGGCSPDPDSDALAWFNARLNTELGYIDELFQNAKELRREKGFDYFSWITERGDGYTNTLRGVYNNTYARARKDCQKGLMVTFTGDDGKESCATCQSLKGKRHRLSWFIANDYIPPFGGALICAKGGQCQHYLETDEGERITE